MAKKSDQKTYKPLSYVGLDGDLKEIVPSGEFKIIKDGYSKSYSCGETYSATDERLIEHAIRLISTKPNFIESEGVEWNLSYVAHIRDMFSEFLNGTCGPEHIPEIALNAVKVKRNLIYTTRLCSAAKLLNQIVNGGYLQGSSDIREVVGIVARESRRWSDESLACKIEKLCGYFESGGFKSSMTRSYFKGTLVKFKIPEGALLRVKFEAGHRDLPSGLEMTIRLKEFPFGYYPKSYFDSNYRNFGAPFVDDQYDVPSNQPIFVGSPYTPDDEKGERTDDLSFLKFYIPHEWIVSVCDYGVNGIASYPVPSHKYLKEDPKCLNTEMKLPDFTGQYADDVRAAASAFSFKENGFLLPYPQKKISKNQLLGFVKGKTDSSRTPDIIESVLRAMRKPGLYILDNIVQWQAINRISPASKIMFFYSSKESEKHICITTGKGGGNVFLINRKLSESIQSSDPQAKAFMHDEKCIETLLGLLDFSITNLSQSAISKVIREELLASNSYSDYLKSKEYMDDLNSVVLESTWRMSGLYL